MNYRINEWRSIVELQIDYRFDIRWNSATRSFICQEIFRKENQSIDKNNDDGWKIGKNRKSRESECDEKKNVMLVKVKIQDSISTEENVKLMKYTRKQINSRCQKHRFSCCRHTIFFYPESSSFSFPQSTTHLHHACYAFQFYSTSMLLCVFTFPIRNQELDEFKPIEESRTGKERSVELRTLLCINWTCLNSRWIPNCRSSSNQQRQHDCFPM